MPLYGLALLFVLCFGVALPGIAQPLLPLEVGLTTVEITPDQPDQLPLAGYINRWGKKAQGVHDPIECQALSIRQMAREAVLVSCDLVGISAIFRQKVSQALSLLGLPSENLMMTATHTHSGPGGFHDQPLFAAGFGDYNEPYTDQVVRQIVAAVQAARAQQQPARVRLANRSVYNLAWNRRDPYARFDHGSRRFQAWHKRAIGLYKVPILSTIWFETPQGSPFAVLFHLPMHNTVFGADNSLLSADWVGVARSKLTAQMPGLKSIYLNGAEADQTPIMRTDQQSDEVYLQEIGETVAQAVLNQYQTAQFMELSPLQSVWHTLPLPTPHLLGIPLSKNWTQGYFESMPLQMLDFGAFTFLAVPLELTAQAGEILQDLAKENGKLYPLVVGLANHYLFYCTLPEEQAQGGYEVWMTLFGTSEFELIRAGFEAVLKARPK